MKKMMMLLLVSVILFSCKKDADRVTPAPVVTPPTEMRIGTAWVYKYTDYDAAGTVVSTSNITLTITSQQTIGADTWWVATGAGAPSYIRKTAVGFYTIKNGVSQLQFKVPAAVNDTWTVTYSATPGDYGDYKVIALNQNVTVPMGTIACYYAEATDANSLEDKVWYNADNMLVKQLEYDQIGAGPLYVDFSLELVSYTL